MKMLGMGKSLDPIPKHCGVVTIFTDSFTKMSMRETAECGAYTKEGMYAFSRVNVHYLMEKYKKNVDITSVVDVDNC